jgi:hypothetical protein
MGRLKKHQPQPSLKQPVAKAAEEGLQAARAARELGRSQLSHQQPALCQFQPLLHGPLPLHPSPVLLQPQPVPHSSLQGPSRSWGEILRDCRVELLGPQEEPLQPSQQHLWLRTRAHGPRSRPQLQQHRSRGGIHIKTGMQGGGRTQPPPPPTTTVQTPLVGEMGRVTTVPAHRPAVQPWTVWLLQPA